MKISSIVQIFPELFAGILFLYFIFDFSPQQENFEAAFQPVQSSRVINDPTPWKIADPQTFKYWNSKHDSAAWIIELKQVCVEHLGRKKIDSARIYLFHLNEDIEKHMWVEFKSIKSINELPKDRLYYVPGNQTTYLTLGPIGRYHGRTMNPGQCIWDVMRKFFPTVCSGEKRRVVGDYPFQRMYDAKNGLPCFDRCQKSNWMCAMGKNLSIFDDNTEIIQILDNENPIACFDRLFLSSAIGIMHYTWFKKDFAHAHNFLTQNFHLEESKQLRVLIYDRGDARKRKWLNAKDCVQRLRGKWRMKVKYVDNMAGYTPNEQFELFYGNDIILCPHGGHLGNVVFIRPGSMLVEISCPAYSWVTKTQIAPDMGVVHLPVGLRHGLDCPDVDLEKPLMHQLHENFNLPIEILDDIVDNFKKGNHDYLTDTYNTKKNKTDENKS